ncbi:unnamed protein product [Mytilus edulis]|uniref:Uncharacterized protein n=1 Tax=Mytilus edulis TaxID=6550 RepID=A0A8S3PYQ4_MYTED|nr:unnamed protein product [Mytilus edulis]
MDMKDDTVKTCLMTDALIMTFGERLYERMDVEEQTPNTIRQKLRHLGRLVDFAKQQGMAFHSISDLIKPANFEVLLCTVKKLAGYDPIERSYGIPTLPVKIGYCLRRCAEINKSAGISANDKSKITNAKNFSSLYDAEWNSRISSIARQTSQKNKCNVQKLLPLFGDVQ